MGFQAHACLELSFCIQSICNSFCVQVLVTGCFQIVYISLGTSSLTKCHISVSWQLFGFAQFLLLPATRTEAISTRIYIGDNGLFCPALSIKIEMITSVGILQNTLLNPGNAHRMETDCNWHSKVWECLRQAFVPVVKTPAGMSTSHIGVPRFESSL